jgi:hypothetical protein
MITGVIVKLGEDESFVSDEVVGTILTEESAKTEDSLVNDELDTNDIVLITAFVTEEGAVTSPTEFNYNNPVGTVYTEDGRKCYGSISGGVLWTEDGEKVLL